MEYHGNRLQYFRYFLDSVCGLLKDFGTGYEGTTREPELAVA
jgi:hypothetical protein